MSARDVSILYKRVSGERSMRQRRTHRSHIRMCDENKENSKNAGINVARLWWHSRQFHAFLVFNGVTNDLPLKKVEQSLGYLSKLAIIEGRKFGRTRYYRFSNPVQCPDNTAPGPLSQHPNHHFFQIPLKIQYRDCLNDALLFPVASNHVSTNASGTGTQTGDTEEEDQSSLTASSAAQSPHNQESPLAELHVASRNTDGLLQDSTSSEKAINRTELGTSSGGRTIVDGYVVQNISRMLSFFQEMLQHGNDTLHYNGDPAMLSIRGSKKIGGLIRFRFECTTCGEEFLFDTDCFVRSNIPSKENGTTMHQPAINLLYSLASTTAGVSTTKLMELLAGIGVPFPTEANIRLNNKKLTENRRRLVKLIKKAPNFNPEIDVCQWTSADGVQHHTVRAAVLVDGTTLHDLPHVQT
eukprot:scaffold3225_cov98-Cylindrotheca_fusiformis.AAC.1